MSLRPEGAAGADQEQLACRTGQTVFLENDGVSTSPGVTLKQRPGDREAATESAPVGERELAVEVPASTEDRAHGDFEEAQYQHHYATQ